MRAPLVAALLFAALPAQAAAPSRSGVSTFVEASPLRGAVGQPAARAELVPWPKVGVDLGYEAWTAASERPGLNDRHAAVTADVLYYPLGLGGYPFFFGGGARSEQADLGRQRPRDSVTWSGPGAGVTDDQWVNHDTYTSVTETIGYRVLTDQLFTVSLRFVRDELVATASVSDSSGVASRGVDLRTQGRAQVQERLEFYAGLWLH